jgi:hypothetical protein
VSSNWTISGPFETSFPQGGHIGTFGPGGESAAHKLLKLDVAAHPLELGFSPDAASHVEYPFATGDGWTCCSRIIAPIGPWSR